MSSEHNQQMYGHNGSSNEATGSGFRVPITKRWKLTEPHDPWYANNDALRGAIAKSVGGYKGQVEKRWHLTPLSLIYIRTNYYSFIQNDMDDSSLLEVEGSAGILTQDDSILQQRIRRLHEVSIETGFIDFMKYYSHISFDVEDANGQIFEFDMIFNEGFADANTGFYAVVWERSTGDEVAHCTTIGDSETKISWKKESLIDRYVPHPGLCPSTSEKFLHPEQWDASPEDREFFACSITYSGLWCTHDNDKNQLELLLAVAAKFSTSEYAVYYPKFVPSEILDEARVAYAEDVLKSSIPREVLNSALGYVPKYLFLDEDSPLPRGMH